MSFGDSDDEGKIHFREMDSKRLVFNQLTNEPQFSFKGSTFHDFYRGLSKEDKDHLSKYHDREGSYLWGFIGDDLELCLDWFGITGTSKDTFLSLGGKPVLEGGDIDTRMRIVVSVLGMVLNHT